MSPSDLVLAAILLAAPVGTPEQMPAPERWPAVREAIHKTAVRWEIMDPREERYLLAAREDFETDLNLLRKRYVELNDAPKLMDCQRLPDRRTVNELIKFNRAFRKNLEEREVWELDRTDLFTQTMQETDRLYQYWDAIRDAQCDFYYVTVRRAALKKLREFIGEEAFLAGVMPPYVPEWRFAFAP
ncbi:Hypothetical conserved protein OS=uncultured planctomycete GN=HGMM_F22C11C15 PE=4 SV=1 [Gemmata massiliana]|uniref:Hypothetical conserved protein n=1 Tax=Gemmata massiliana TaxID=1210884 RepID=A0A6P2CPU8_9BACT|nr:hypothetical protein [Gemmata massiliana]VTR90859.1 Hypothetical conserved protein OS=uncultured planctomycete GN=HGMM_F22C11C15 PE=4 SV=1 [Gemmata massiliana]